MIVFAREPVFDSTQQLFAYQLVFRDGDEGSLPASLFAQDTVKPHDLDEGFKDGVSAGSLVGLDELLKGNVSIISVRKDDLIHGLPNEFLPQDTIIEISDINDDETALISAIQNLREKGFRFVIHNKTPLSEICLSLADYLKININNISLLELKLLQSEIAEKSIKTIATRVESHTLFQKCIEAGFDYFQGFFFLSRPKHSQQELPANKLSMLELIALTSQKELDTDKVRAIFEKDPTLSYLLLRFINNPLINKSHKISSIKHALSYLGEVMLRKFIAIVSVAHLNQNNVQELLHVSLVRAKFCELLDDEIFDSNDAMSAFMVGLLSLIDVILQRDMRELLNQISLSNAIKRALIERKGQYALILACVRALESSSWMSLKAISNKLGVTETQVQAHLHDSILWANSIHQVDSPVFPRAKTE
uniref:EAL and HDOD domain-containing protein n=1 Tax=Ningiella ruwaisensis TaxID=2364274 RepID=UPI0010A01DD7|nr:HDOD domain-containing protein [Ningiella ruwaisensis]